MLCELLKQKLTDREIAGIHGGSECFYHVYCRGFTLHPALSVKTKALTLIALPCQTNNKSRTTNINITGPQDGSGSNQRGRTQTGEKEVKEKYGGK